jgi:hypothetical protein
MIADGVTRNSLKRTFTVKSTMSNIEKEITVVSGLPRSGTSLTMRMLETGGMPVIIDQMRRPDADNPRGYYEFEPAKKLKTDMKWLNHAPGKAVKMVYRLLYDLPPKFTYRVLFMQRKLDEVLVSQKTMLVRHGNYDNVDEREMMSLFSKEIAQCKQWIQRQTNFFLLEVDYNRLILEPKPIVSDIVDFLGREFDHDAMCKVIDKDLYHIRC